MKCGRNVPIRIDVCLRREVTGDGDENNGRALPSGDLLGRHQKAVLLRVELNRFLVQLLHVVPRGGFHRSQLEIQCLFAGIDQVDLLDDQGRTTSVGIE